MPLKIETAIQIFDIEQTITDHFKNDTNTQTVHKKAVTIKLDKYVRYFIEKEIKKKTYYMQVREKWKSLSWQ